LGFGGGTQPTSGGTRPVGQNRGGGGGFLPDGYDPDSGLPPMDYSGESSGTYQPTPECQMEQAPGQPGPQQKIGNVHAFGPGENKSKFGQEPGIRAKAPSRYRRGTPPVEGVPFLPDGPSRYSQGTPQQADTGLLDEQPEPCTGTIDWTAAGVTADAFTQDRADTLTDESWRIDLINGINAALNRTQELDLRQRSSFPDDLGLVSIVGGASSVVVNTSKPTTQATLPNVQLTPVGVAVSPFYSGTQNADGTWAITVEIPATNPGPAVIEIAVVAWYPIATTVSAC
jgi:hypothetical protein